MLSPALSHNVRQCSLAVEHPLSKREVVGSNPAIGFFVFSVNFRPLPDRSEGLFFARPRGLMDKASVFGTEDCRFESYRGHLFIDMIMRFGYRPQ